MSDSPIFDELQGRRRQSGPFALPVKATGPRQVRAAAPGQSDAERDEDVARASTLGDRELVRWAIETGRVRAEDAAGWSTVFASAKPRAEIRQELLGTAAGRYDNTGKPIELGNFTQTTDGRHVTPLVARLAAERGVALASIKGTGVGGRITKSDVLAAAPAAPTDQDEASYQALFGDDGSRAIAAGTPAAASRTSTTTAATNRQLTEAQTLIDREQLRVAARGRLASGPDLTIEEYDALTEAAYGGLE